MAQATWIRDYLRKKGYNDNEIGFDTNNQTVTVRNQPFIQAQSNVDGKSYASQDALDAAYSKINPLTQGPGNTVDRYRNTAGDTLSKLLNNANTPFTYDPQTDPRYQAALNIAKQDAATASHNAAEQLNGMGILNSTITGDRLGHIQQDAYGRVSNELVPQFYNQALNERNSNNQLLQNLAQMMLGQANNSENFSENQRQFNEGNAINKGQLTGKYVDPTGYSLAQELVGLKDLNRNGGNQQASARADQIRSVLPQYGIDPSLFGADITPEQARSNLSQIGQTTLPAKNQQFTQGIEQAGVTGYYNGQPTLQREQMNSENIYRDSALNAKQNQPNANDAMGQLVNDIQNGMSPDARKKFFTEKKADIISEFGISGYNQLYSMFFDKDGNPIENPSKPYGATPQSTAGLINNAARSYGISPKLLSAVAMQESGMGQASNNVMQVNGMDDSSPEQSVNVGAQMLSDLLKKTGGSVPWALAAYNMGPGILDFARSRGITDPRVAMREFQKYQMANGYSSGYGDAEYIDHVARYL